MGVLNSLKQTINFYMAHFVFVDYLAVMWVLLVFLVVLFLVIIMMIKRPLLASFILIANIFFVVFGLIYTHKLIDENLRKRELIVDKITQLNFSDTLIADLNLTNLSKKPFKYCRIKLNFNHEENNKIKHFIKSAKPFRTQTHTIEEPIDVNQTKTIRLIINDFRPINYTTKVSSECF
ncbi:putative DUF2393 domain protein [Campylobacter iguaniorum]|uniref:DUF2393 family protein n=1 Tax=Campylobacter iguaniorum TaxID=1244531 RepID=UPI0007C921FF|nr:DUF2393 family protein [Campylobacter iguaniorum]ANE35349.1 putative DUF2393 domain protein [Campylobacter iguaniorum]